MNRVIHFIDDDCALNPYVTVLRESQRLPGVSIHFSESIDEALAWCDESDARVLFIVDSRMFMTPDVKARLELALAEEGMALDGILGGDPDLWTGALGALLLRRVSPGCRIILLSAYARTLLEHSRTHPKLSELLGRAIDAVLSKSDSADLTRVIEQELSRL